MADYYGMTSIDTAVVSDTGDLLIGLTDGNVINAGYVRGRPGPQGERGLMGPTGDPGRNGLDGAQLYTGVGAPADDMGVEGDLYIDLASRFLDIFQKTGGGWIVISTLRDASDSKGSGFLPGMSGTHDGDGGGGGSSVIIDNNTDGPAFGNGGAPLQPGDLWYNPDTGHLHVRSANNLEWIPIAGLPSAEFSADPPTEDRGGHPIEPGDLWWDTDLAALFVAALDSSDQLVWVVALPADRSAVPDEQNPFVLPFSADGTIATNPTTGIRYIYHAAKNQWIDIPTTGNSIFYQEDTPTMENVNLGVGDLWIKESDKQVYVFNGLSWDEVRARPKVYNTDEPPADASEGELYFDSGEEELTLYIRYNGDWVPAAPPVSTEGLESAITSLESDVQQLLTSTRTAAILASEEELKVLNLQESQAEQDTKIEALEASQTVQDNQIIELEEEIESLAPSLDRGKWNLAELGEGVTLAAGQYAMGIGANRVYCEEQYAQCLAAIDGNPSENPEASGECNRIASACFNAVDNGTEYFMNDWSHATLLHFHKTDSEGKNHTFADYKVGMFIDLFDQGDTGFAVFEITAAATLDGDVYTIGVHPVQHEGEAAGLARVKVFELAGADPTEFVRNTGDTMTGALYIRPPKDSAGLRIYAPQGDAGAGQADATQLVRVANSHNQYVFYVEESGAIAGKDGMLPTVNRHLTSKKYVDELIAAELTAPARFEWKVYVNADGTPLQGSANLNGASMSDTSVIRLHKHALNAPVPIKGHGSGLTMYKHSPSPKLYYSTILSAWSKSGAEWQWKGTAEIDEIKLFSDYIQIKLGYRKESNMNFSNTGYYRFTVGGLF